MLPTMPACHCESYSCNGKDVSHRIFENHKREDKRRFFCQAYTKATEICDKQIDDIATHVSSLTLSGNATGTSSAPGGRLWSRSVQDDDIPFDLSSLTLQDNSTGNDAPRSTDAPRRSQVSPRHSPINDALSELAKIEKELDSLTSVAEPQLTNLAVPSSRDDPFPLKSTISAACSLRDRLSSVTNQASSVRKTRATISDRLSSFLEELMDCNTLWNKKTQRLPEVKEIIPMYETGERIPLTFFSKSLIEFLSSPF